MARCETRSGRFQCSKDAGHEGECEAIDEAPAYPARPIHFGPFRHPAFARAYLRGWLDSAQGTSLDVAGAALDAPRGEGEDDVTYRERLWRGTAGAGARP